MGAGTAPPGTLTMVVGQEASSKDGPGGKGLDEAGFRHTGERVAFTGWAFTATQATFVAPDGEVFERDIVRHPGAVAVVPITDDGAVLLVRQWRPTVRRWLLEIPAGTRDVAGEPTEETARRELAEEVGRRAAELTLLTRCLNTPGFCDEETTVYAATGLVQVPDDRQGVEERFMTVEAVPLAEFDGLVDAGVIVDAATILGVGLARRRLDLPGDRRQGSPEA